MKGPILHPAQLTLYTDAYIIAILHPTHNRLFPPQTQVGKLGNELPLPGAVQQKEEVCCGANVQRSYSVPFAVCKSVALYSDAILKGHFTHLH